MYFAKEKKTEELRKAAEKKTGETSKKRAEKSLLKLFGAKFDEDELESVNSNHYNLYDKMGKRNSVAYGV